ncbi:MAG: ATP-grasp domain-containing protein [Hyphomonadaceae bacterium]|nr:ATP-grasp domain-containing protein [Hyphomonadaceae bacterium]
MTKTVLLTIGRLPKALDFARSFYHADWRVLVGEPFKSHLTGASKCVAQSFVLPAPRAGKAAYLEALGALVDAQKVDLVLPLSEETMHVAHLQTQAQIYAPSPNTLLELHNKASFIALAQRLGLAVPETALIGTPKATQIAAQHDYVIKPIYSCSGRGMSFHKQSSAIRAGTTSDPNEAAIVQQQLSGRQVSTFGIAHQGKMLANVVYEGLIMSGSVAVAFTRIALAEVDSWVEQFVARTGHSGFISFDFVDEHGIARAIECNPRVTSGVHFWKRRAWRKQFCNPIRPNWPTNQPTA